MGLQNASHLYLDIVSSFQVDNSSPFIDNNVIKTAGSLCFIVQSSYTENQLGYSLIGWTDAS